MLTFFAPNSRSARLTLSILVLTALLWLLAPQVLLDAYVSSMYAIAPSAERAYRFGTKHFDATHPDDYDLERAEYFFNEGLKRDADMPFVHHQLARIAFLKGNFPLAMRHINTELETNPDPSPSSYYVRGLIEGFMGKYNDAAKDYEAYLRADPNNWAAINDYAWVLLKDKRYRDALVALDWGLITWPENPWLHNSRATALFEMGRLEEALEAAEAASRAMSSVTEASWLQAYPGNDPLIAPQGIEAFRKAVEENMHTISLAIENIQKGVR